MHVFARLVFVAAVAAALGSLACVGPEGEDASVIASLTVVGSLDSNTCGAQAVTLPDPWARRAELESAEGGLYYWREVSSGVIAQGTRTTSGEYRFRGSSEAQLLPADVTQDYPGCRVRLDDELRFTLEAGAAFDAGVDAGGETGMTQTLVGRQTTVVSIVAGSNCSPALNANGGNFLALPCEFAYDLEGTTDAE